MKLTIESPNGQEYTPEENIYKIFTANYKCLEFIQKDHTEKTFEKIDLILLGDSDITLCLNRF